METDSPPPPPARPVERSRNPWKVFGVGTILLVVSSAAVLAGFLLGTSSDEAASQLVPTIETTTTEASTTTRTQSTTTPSATTPNASDDFVETFEDNQGLNRFDTGVWHRNSDQLGNDPIIPGENTWTGDHDLKCGGPDTQRTIDKADRTDSFYTCRDHVMTSVGAVDAYSVGWFSPAQTFDSADTDRVSWDVNVTDLMKRQWTEVTLIPADYDTGIPNCRYCTAEVGAAGDLLLSAQIPGAVRFGGPFGGGKPIINEVEPVFRSMCRGGALDLEGCASKALRRNWTVTDNRDGTLTATFLGNVWTVPGEFPRGEFVVMFKDHNYTPDKDGTPVGHTWHWDNISIT